MNRRWCRLFGCGSWLGRWFAWPHGLCSRAVFRKIEKGA